MSTFGGDTFGDTEKCSKNKQMQQGMEHSNTLSHFCFLRLGLSKCRMIFIDMFLFLIYIYIHIHIIYI